MRIRTTVAAVLAGFGLTGFGMAGVAVADTAPAAQRIHCGMEVREHAHLYLTRDLECETPFGVRVRGVNTDDGCPRRR